MRFLGAARSWALAVMFAIVAVIAACTSPTLPLPPPALPSIVAGTEPDTYRLSSDKGSLPNALVVVINRNETLPANKRVTGTLADDQGSWELIVIAKPGDVLDVSQEDGTNRSPSTTVQVK